MSAASSGASSRRPGPPPGLPGLLDAVAEARAIALFLDYDGTLVGLRRTPGEARLHPRRRAALGRLAARGLVAIVSGRAVDDVARMVAIPGLIYAGNHGLEISAPGWRWTHPAAARSRRAMGEVLTAAARAMERFPGAWIQDKGASGSIHVRAARPEAERAALRAARRAAAAFPGTFRLIQGKKVLDVVPAADWDKGRVVRLILDRSLRGGTAPPIPVYIGDDRTDEDAFRALERRGVTAIVGRRRGTRARFALRDVDEVWRILRALERR